MWGIAYMPNESKFSSVFSENELFQLSTFDEFYLERMSSFPSGITNLMKNPYWNSVCEYASQLLQDFEKCGKI